VEGFKGLLAEDVVFLGTTAARGRAAAVESWKPLFSQEGPRLTWEPREVVVAESGELAYSSGEWHSVPAGGGEAATGRYLTLWRRHPRHGWLVVVDGSRADDLEALVGRAARELRLDPAAVVEPRLDRGSPKRQSSAAGDLTWTLAPITLRFTTADGPVEATATLLTIWRPDDPVDPAAQAVSGFQQR
jgi:ketosteroid isomerase-like protein